MLLDHFHFKIFIDLDKFISTMNISRTQFCLVIKAICYIVLSSTSAEKENCKIPTHGIVCTEDKVVEPSNVRLNAELKDMACSTWDDGIQERVAVSGEISLDPDGIGMFCDHFWFSFVDNKILISRSGDALATSSHPRLEKIVVYINDGKDKWQLSINKIVQAGETYGQFDSRRQTEKDIPTPKVIFSFLSHSKGVTAPIQFEDAVKKNGDNPIEIYGAYYVSITQESPLEIKPQDVDFLSGTLDWNLGYKLLQQYHVSFIKRYDSLFISVAVAKDRERSVIEH